MYPYITIFGFSVGTYGLWMLAGLFAAFFCLCAAVSQPRHPLGVRAGGHLLRLWAGASGRLCFLYALFRGRAGDCRGGAAGALLETLSQGGIVFYGGLFGGLLGAWLGCRIVGLRFLPVLDLCAPALALGHAFGRVGCLFAGCCYGMPCDLPLLLRPFAAYRGRGAAFAGAADRICLRSDPLRGAASYLRKRRPVPRAAGVFLMSYAAYRFILEFFPRRPDSRLHLRHVHLAVLEPAHLRGRAPCCALSSPAGASNPIPSAPTRAASSPREAET